MEVIKSVEQAREIINNLQRRYDLAKEVRQNLKTRVRVLEAENFGLRKALGSEK